MKEFSELFEALRILGKNINIGIHAETTRILHLQATELLSNFAEVRDLLPVVVLPTEESATTLLDLMEISIIEILAGGMKEARRRSNFLGVAAMYKRLVEGLQMTPDLPAACERQAAMMIFVNSWEDQIYAQRH